jgi:ATP-binding cassette subfamily C protein CydCD
VEQLEVYFGQFLPQFLIALLAPVMIFVVIAFLDLPVAAVMLAFALLALFAPALWHRHDVANSLGRQKSYAAFAAEFLDSIQGLATLKTFGQSKARADKLEFRPAISSAHHVVLGTMCSPAASPTARSPAAAAALALGAWRVEAGAMSLTALLVILMLGVEIYRPMRELRTVLHQGMVGMSAAQGIYQILDDRPDVADSPPAALAAPLAPAIAFEGVGFHYPGARRAVVGGLDFAIAPGAHRPCRPSGGGKSSSCGCRCASRSQQGRITLGGHDLRSLSFQQIRSLISVVNQDTFLFHGTVEENIRMGRPEASTKEVEAAAQAANIHDFIARLPQGYRTIIGEKGIKLSGGQRQRVAIARALLRDTPILLLDEALSAVDAENEAAIQQALDRLMRGRTTLVLAHRLSSVIGCDRILVLDGGRIAESGAHGALMRAGGIYAGLMAEQARESEPAEPIEESETPRGLERVADGAGGAVKTVTEGIIKAEGLGWRQLTIELMKLVLPWKGRLAATFILGVLRVIAFIGVGVLSAMAVFALKIGAPIAPWLWALAVVAPLSGVIHWLESWIAHDMAFRLLAEMRIAIFRKLDALAPAYLVRRRTGDLMALATHDVEMVEYFFAHTVAPAFVAVLVPAVVLVVLGWASPWMRWPCCPSHRRRPQPLPDARASTAWSRAGLGRARRLCRRFEGRREIVAFQRRKRAASVSMRSPTGWSRCACPSGELGLQQSLLEI